MRGEEQLGLDGMPARLYACTPTRLSTWLGCRRQYRMSYLDRPTPRKGPPWAHNSLGASVHNALAGWWRLPQPQRAAPPGGRGGGAAAPGPPGARPRRRRVTATRLDQRGLRE